jgi:hypothetical protein
MIEVKMIIRGEEHRFSRDDVIHAARRVIPEPIKTYYVEVEGKRFPPKQLIRLVTGTGRPFDSMNARAALTRLDFVVRAE